MVTDIGFSFQMKTNKFQKDFRVKKFSMLSGTSLQSVYQEVAKRAAKPVMSWNVKADFLTGEDGLRQLFAHELAQNEFLL